MRRSSTPRAADRASRAAGFFDRYYVVLAVAVLGLAAFNLLFRLGSEFVGEWDESLYAISAWEAVDKGSWIGTTFLGELDYYNTKPPMMVWLIALTFKAFGLSLTTLRLVPALSAWVTVAVLQYWAKRCFGSIVVRVNPSAGKADLAAVLVQARISLGQQDARRWPHDNGHQDRGRHRRPVEHLQHIIAMRDLAGQRLGSNCGEPRAQLGSRHRGGITLRREAVRPARRTGRGSRHPASAGSRPTPVRPERPVHNRPHG